MADNNSNNEGPLDKLKKRLYRKDEGFEERGKEPKLREYSEHTPKNWPAYFSEEEIEEAIVGPGRKARSKTLIIALGCFLFLLISGAAAIWYLLGGFGGISPKDIALTIEGPRELAGGDLAEWKIFIENRSDQALEFADLVFQYPDGSRVFDQGGRSDGLLRDRRALKSIAPNSRVEESFRAFIFGEKDTTIQAAASLEYRFEGSNVILARDEVFDTRITRSPVVVSLSAPEALNSGDRFELKVEFISEAKDILKASELDVEYPDNFTFVEASPKPTEKNSKWAIGDLKPGERRTIIISGFLNSQEFAEETFRATVGVPDGDGHMVFGSDSAVISLARQFLDISFRLSGSQVIKPATSVNVDIFWKNNLPVAVENAILKVALTGQGFDLQTLRAENGSYVAADNAMRWGPVSYPSFSFIEPGEEGVLRLNFNVPRSFDIRSPDDTNFGVNLKGNFDVPKRPLGFENVDIAGERDLDLKVETDMQFARVGLYHFPALPGSGPLPPKVGQETIYTVIWSLFNTTNDVKSGVVSATLPQYMIWKGRVSPGDSKITYNNLTGKIEWKFDFLRSGTGIIRPAREVMFQVGFIPSVPDIGKSPTIISEAAAFGIDNFTGTELRDSEPALTIDLRNDPQFKGGDGQVVP